MHQILSHHGYGHLADLPCLTLITGKARAVVSLYGGQVLSYQPQPEQELLWLSPAAGWLGQPIRGGIPICWPWFGPIPVQLNPQSFSHPNHGPVRTLLWQCLEQHITEHSTSVTLEVLIRELPYYNEPVRLTLSVTLTGKALQLDLNCNQSLKQQAALHSYFKVADLKGVRLTPLPSKYYDKLKDGQLVNADTLLQFDQEIDRIYPATGNRLNLETQGIKLDLHQQGHDATVVWNPGQIRCQTMSDLLADSYQQFVCVESAKLDLSEQQPLKLSLVITSLN